VMTCPRCGHTYKDNPFGFCLVCLGDMQPYNKRDKTYYPTEFEVLDDE